MSTKKTEKPQVHRGERPGAIYVGHIPHGFYEEQMKKYFSQFGTVTGVHMARSTKSGRSKGFGFVHFACDEVAKIAAETMNNYLMFNKLLKCHVVPQEKLHSTATSRRPKVLLTPKQRQLRELRRHNKAKTASRRQKQLHRLLSCEQKKRAKLQALGLDYDFPGYQAAVTPYNKTPSHTLFIDDDEKIVENPTEL